MQLKDHHNQQHLLPTPSYQDHLLPPQVLQDYEPFDGSFFPFFVFYRQSVVYMQVLVQVLQNSAKSIMLAALQDQNIVLNNARAKLFFLQVVIKVSSLVAVPASKVKVTTTL